MNHGRYITHHGAKIDDTAGEQACLKSRLHDIGSFGKAIMAALTTCFDYGPELKLYQFSVVTAVIKENAFAGSPWDFNELKLASPVATGLGYAVSPLLAICYLYLVVLS